MAMKNGFTLVELLIVVIILSVLASIALPQFQQSSNDAKLSALKATLTSLRTAIQYYEIQHGHFPGELATVGTCAAGANIDNATAGASAFVAHLSYYSTRAGVACTVSNRASGGKIKYGPYLKSSQFPVNPMTGSNEVEAIQTGSLDVPATGIDTDGGWKYDFTTGVIIANQPTYENL